MRGHTEFLHNGSLIKNGVRSAIQLDDSRTGTHCARSLSGVHMITRSTRCRRCDRRSREGVICLEFHNRPNHDASCQEDLFEQRELRQEIRVNTVACLIVWP